MKLSSHVVEVCDFNERKIYICLTEIQKKIVILSTLATHYQ